ncbi:FMN-binding negative transcriptional regulator [Cellulomonas carbonis]|uniref:FMN-binding negative transcriptional regulator n=1 Tax=Cellulomonas carbonis TaxID=1386092 RepID=UPI00166CA45C|nr:FMN-binding negative transcriptional regulator [Cellulomonas carbonis]GGC17882.1 hypothetical protein GCM10010972_33900 [Cellulomonas carbonis]
MLVPRKYQAPDQSHVLQVIEDFPLATLITAAPDIHVSQVPIVADRSATRGAGAQSSATGGVRLRGHMNRANPHARSAADGAAAYLVFNGPNGYVSPSVYTTRPSAPTWNFVTVHVTGALRWLDRPADARAVVTDTADRFEQKFGPGEWRADLHTSYIEQLLPGVRAFELEDLRFDAMYKLSQELAPDQRAHVAESLKSRSGSAEECGLLMERLSGANSGDVVSPPFSSVD